jgi:hypothetical protein
VSSNDEDDALTWAGGRDPSHYETPEVKAPKPSKASKTSNPTKATNTTEPALAGADGNADADELRPATSGVVLVSLGILGGIYLLYTIGWIISWQRLAYTDPDLLELGAFRVQQVLAIVAAPLWFGATIFFTRDRRPAFRLLWLVIGALLLVPWSFTFGR